MRSFFYEYLGDRIEIVFSLVKNGRWRYNNSQKKIALQFDYPYPENDDELRISMADLEEMDEEVRSMLFQALKMDAPEFNLSYS